MTVVDLNVDHGNQVCAEIVNAGGHAIFAKADISKPGAVIAAIDTAVGKWGKVDVVLNDAAMMTFKPIVDLPDEESTTF